MRRVSQATFERKIRDGEWEAMSGTRCGYWEVRDCRSGRRFMVEVL